MLVLICGDRRWADYRCPRCEKSLWPCPSCTTSNKGLNEAIKREIEAHGLDPEKDVIMHGAAKGADKIAGEWGDKLGFKTISFPANWDVYGRGAGPVRNKQMLNEHPDLVLAFHRDIALSKGTKHMIRIATEAGVKVEVFNA